MEEIVERIMNADKWPCIPFSENIEILNEMADTYFNSSTFDGMLAATILYHQIIEAMCIHLLDDCHFLIQLSLYPYEIDPKTRCNKMLGFYVDELKSSVGFEHKDNFISKVQSFSSIRNEVIHQMRRSNIDEFSKKLYSIKLLFDEIFALYDLIQDDFRCVFHSFQKDTFIDYIY